jgi:hypothetical protein
MNERLLVRSFIEGHEFLWRVVTGLAAR